MKPLILWGGEDVWPGFYGADPHPKAGPFNPERDIREVRLIKAAMALDQPIVGICRGAQLLCVANNGSLWQHSLGHNQAHDIITKDLEVFKDVSADHHQIMRPEGKCEVLAYAEGPTIAYGATDKQVVLARVPEVIWWPETKCLGIQPHPEWEPKGSAFVQWINEVMKEKGIDYEF